MNSEDLLTAVMELLKIQMRIIICWYFIMLIKAPNRSDQNQIRSDQIGSDQILLNCDLF